MIKVGIIGASLPLAGEILRILVRHPEVDIKSLYAPEKSGQSVNSCHHGFIGEKIVNFSDKFNPANLDIVFIADNSETGLELIQQSDAWPDLKIVDISPDRFHRWEACGMEYGLSEINRKALVRGARLAIIPSAPASLALIALYPLACHLLLNSAISIRISAHKDILMECNVNSVVTEISTMLKKAQASFNSSVNVELKPENMSRTMRVEIEMASEIPLEEIDKAYELVYDDHNFTFTSLSRAEDKEVEGTQKCVILFTKPSPGVLRLECVGDARMRGGAGDAVHILNLFFALDEKVGLNLKPSVFGNEKSGTGTSWFA